MSSSRICPKCGASNPASNQYCGHCGSSMTSAIEPTPSQPPSPALEQISIPYSTQVPRTHPNPWTPPADDYYTGYLRKKRWQQIDRTKKGLTLLVVGLILGAFPYISILGGLLGLIGAILVILGRNVFGETHSKYTIWSLVLYIIGFIASFSLGAIIAATIYSAARAGTATLAETAASSITGLLLAAAVIGAIFGLAQVLLTYAVQAPRGRDLLWTAYAASIALSVVIAVLIGPQYSQAFRLAFSAGSYDPTPIQSVQNQHLVLALFNILPAGLFALAYYMAGERIARGEIPEESSPSSPY